MEASSVRQTYEYDGRGQLLAVKDADGNDVERYRYDRAGNMVRKSLLKPGRAVSTKPPTSEDYTITTFTFDGANQLVSSTTDGVTTKYVYDAAGRLVKEGNKTYRYGYLDKVLSVTEGERKYAYDYHVDGQLARADYGNGGRAGCPQPAGSEDFLWDGLALIRRGDERFVNEPHVGGGNPVASSKGTTYFNDMLGTTLGAKRNRKYTPAALTAFGETIENGGVRSTPTPSTYTSFYTGKPYVEGLGHAFLFRNYRAGLAKWQTADPMGYPDGWNQLAYCNNGVINQVDYLGCGIIESTIQKATQAKIDEFLNSGSIEKAVEGLILPSPKDDSDLEVFAKVSIELSDITVKYRHGFIFDTESEMKLANRQINKNIFKKLTRLRPDIYRIRDPKNDSLGPSGAVDSNTSSNNENVGYSQTEWLYTVTVDEISFTIKMHIDYSTIWRHFKPE